MQQRTGRPVVATVTAMDAYQRRILTAAHHVLADRGIPLLVHVDGAHARGLGSPLLVSLLSTSAPRGVILMNRPEAAEQQAIVHLLDNLAVPVVHVGSEAAAGSGVRGDNETGMTQLLSHLLDDRQVRHPALVRGSLHQADSIAREQVFRRELARRGLELDEDLVVTGDFRPEVTYPAVRALLARRSDVDAIVALNDPMALATMEALADAGRRVPEDVLVTGFDDDAVAGLWPGVTTVDQHLEEQGRTAATLLLELWDGAPPRNVVVPSQLVVRGSTAGRGRPPPIDLASATAMARHGRAQLANEAARMALTQALEDCWTVEQTVATVSEHLDRLGVDRCFIALHERPDEDDDAVPTGDPEVAVERAELVLDHHDGRRHAVATESFPSHRLLPDQLRGELDHGLLVLQPLGVLDRPLGYVLFEQPAAGGSGLAELLRIHLGRAVDGVLTTREQHTRAERLEHAIDRRTKQLRKEVQVRERAERELQRANVELRRSAMVDGLTQIANRAAFEEYLDEHWDRQAVEGGTLALVMADVDEFKAYNDHYGHVAGDDALRTVAACLDRSVRASQDLACRYGGEEFAVVLPDCGVDGAVAVARRFRELLAGFGIPHAASPVAPTLTVSVGVATARPVPGTHPNDVVGAADRALYRAKDLGRDRIVIDPASHELPPVRGLPRSPSPAHRPRE